MRFHHICGTACLCVVCGFSERTTLSGDGPQLPQIARDAATDDESRQKLYEMLVQLPQDDLSMVLSRALEDGDENVREVAAGALPSLVDQNDFRRFLTKAVADKSERVRRTALCAALALRSEEMTPDERASALSDESVIVRTTGTLACSDINTLLLKCHDGSALVRAAALRKLCTLMPVAESVSAEAIRVLDACLVDHEGLVRSEALLAGRRYKHLPLEIARGHAWDARQTQLLEDVLSFEKSGAEHREQYGVVDQYFPCVYFARDLQLHVTIGSIPPAQYPIVLFPIGQRELIGTSSMIASAYVHPNDRDEIITWFRTGTPGSVLLGQQLARAADELAPTKK